MPKSEYRCYHCKVIRPTSQGLNKHIRSTSQCWEAFQTLLSEKRSHARVYYPDDPETHPRDDEPPNDWQERGFGITFDMIQEEDSTMQDNLTIPPLPHENINSNQTRKGVPSPSNSLYIEPYPGIAATILGYGHPTFEAIHEERATRGTGFFYPFADRGEWEFARTLMTSGMSLQVMDKILKLPIVRDRCQLTYKNKDALLEKIDALPSIGPQFIHTTIKVSGDLLDTKGQNMVEELDVFYRDPVECVRELISNPAFHKVLHYAPQRVFEDETCAERIYNEMYTADWWWDTQGKLSPGATIVPIILASDKTKLSYFSGDKSAWPVYISIGNIEKATRRRPSSRAMILLGYIPVSKLKSCHKERRSIEGQRLFHYCMDLMLKPIKSAGIEGIEMTCADNAIRRIHPLLAAYIADHPEQCLITCVQENRCPKCRCAPEDRGEPLHSIFMEDEPIYRDHETHLKSARFKKTNVNNPSVWFDDGVRLVTRPFWRDLPHCNVFECITPDILHQLHKGVFKDHLTNWCISLIGKAEMDARFMAVPLHPSIRHFKNGISSVSQWTGTEYKNMEKIFLGLLYEAAGVPGDVLHTARALLDFIYLAQYQSHSTTTLHLLSEALKRFHKYKTIFINLGIREDFEIPKFHSLEHYVEAIKSRGTVDGFNTELPERLHIDFAKVGYRASNRKQYIEQMVKWLMRQERIHEFDAYLDWCEPKLHEVGEGDGEEAQAREQGAADQNQENVIQDDKKAYHIAKQPTFPNVSISDVITQFHATDIIPALTTFLRHAIPMRPFHLNTSVRLNLYKRVTIKLQSIQQLDDNVLMDVIRAYPYTPPYGCQKAIPARFDTVLVHHTDQAQDTGALGYRAARVRAIFQLPEYFEYTLPLAYIEWYSDLADSPTANIEMYRVSKLLTSTKTAVVPLSSIRRSCHLIPRMGKKVNRMWNAEDVLDIASQFFISDYLDLDTYQFFNDY